MPRGFVALQEAVWVLVSSQAPEGGRIGARGGFGAGFCRLVRAETSNLGAEMRACTIAGFSLPALILSLAGVGPVMGAATSFLP